MRAGYACTSCRQHPRYDCLQRTFTSLVVADNILLLLPVGFWASQLVALQKMSSSGTAYSSGQGRKVTTYGKKTGRVVIETGMSRRQFLEKVVAGSGSSTAAAAVGQPRQITQNGYRDSPIFRTESQITRDDNGYAATGFIKLDRPAVDVVVRKLRADEDANLPKAAMAAKPPGSVKKVSASSIASSVSDVSEFEIIHKPRQSSKTSGKAREGARKPAARRVIVVDSPPTSPPPWSSLPAMIELPTAPATSPLKRGSTIGSTQAPDDLPSSNQRLPGERPRIGVLGRKDSNSTSPSKAKQAIVADRKSKAMAPPQRPALSPVRSSQPPTIPFSRHGLASTPSKRPLAHHGHHALLALLTSTPRADQPRKANSSKDKVSMRMAPASDHISSMRQVQVQPPRGHGSDATATWRQTVRHVDVHHAALNKGRQKRHPKTGPDHVLADIARQQTRGSPSKSAARLKAKDETPGETVLGAATTPIDVGATAIRAGPLDTDSARQATPSIPSSRRVSSPRPAQAAVLFPLVTSAPVGLTETLEGEEDVADLIRLCNGSIGVQDRTATDEKGLYAFSDFVERCPLLPEASCHWTKLGEATYSEVFLVSPKPFKSKSAAPSKETIVVKIIPLHSHRNDHLETVDSPQTSFPKDVSRELRIIQALGSLACDTVTGGSASYPDLKGYEAFALRRKCGLG